MNSPFNSLGSVRETQQKIAEELHRLLNAPLDTIDAFKPFQRNVDQMLRNLERLDKVRIDFTEFNRRMDEQQRQMNNALAALTRNLNYRW